MAILTRSQILARMRTNELGFKPNLDTFQLQEHSVDLRLGFTFLIPKSWQLTPKGREAVQIDPFTTLAQSPYFDVVELEQGQYFELLPGEHITVSTLEAVKVPDDLMGVLYPRSSTNRRGLSVDLTGIIDSGYEGQLIIPLRNSTPHQTIRLYPGERICQIIFEELGNKVTARKSRYHKKDIIEGAISNTLPGEREVEMALLMKGEVRKLKAEHMVELPEVVPPE
jgi:dCTP deaminase